MLYGNPYFGVMEGNYSIAAVHLLTAALGPRFWHWPLVTTGPTGTLSLRDAAILVLTAVGGTLQVSGQLARVFGRAAPPLPASERGAKQRGAGAAAWHLAQLCLVLALGGAWLADGRVAPGQCRLVQVAFGVVYALTASQLIVAHMAKEPFEPPAWALGVLAAGAANSRLRLVDGRLAAAALAAVAIAGYAHYVVSVVAQICDYLQIRCFSIAGPPRPASGLAAKKGAAAPTKRGPPKAAAAAPAKAAASPAKAAASPAKAAASPAKAAAAASPAKAAASPARTPRAGARTPARTPRSTSTRRRAAR
jgi:ethanolaminephosphotransferase